MRLRIDPWAASYDGPVQVDDDVDEPDVDTSVETDDWAAIKAEDVTPPDTIAFVDGVQRVDIRVLADLDDKIIYGAFASLGIGAAISRGDSSSIRASGPVRILALTDGASEDPIKVPCGSMALEYRAHSSAASGPGAVSEVLMSARRDAETKFAESLIDDGIDLVVVDGRLNFQPTRESMVVGFIKSMHRQYLQPDEAALLSDLPVGSRTPLFRIPRDRPLYSWHIRLADQRPIDHPWTGLARLETQEAIGLEAAVRLANLTATTLPRYATTSTWDPRAPQNLYSISALEERLRHELGDPEWIRRAIESHLIGEQI